MAKKEPEGFATDDQKEKAREVAEQMQKAREERAEQITVDLDEYSKFVQVMTSAPSKKFDSYVERINELNEAGCDVSRLNTAAIGIYHWELADDAIHNDRGQSSTAVVVVICAIAIGVSTMFRRFGIRVEGEKRAVDVRSVILYPAVIYGTVVVQGN